MAYAVNFSAGNWGGLIDDLEDVIAVADKQTEDQSLRSSATSTYATLQSISVTNDSDKLLAVNFFAIWSGSADGDIIKMRQNVNGNAGSVDWLSTQSSATNTGGLRHTETLFFLVGDTGTFNIAVDFARADGSGTIYVSKTRFEVLYLPYRGSA